MVGASFAKGVALAQPGATARVKAVASGDARGRKRHRRNAPARTITTSSWPGRTSTPSPQARASTTTARAPPRFSRPPDDGQGRAAKTPYGSHGGAPRSRASSARRPTCRDVAGGARADRHVPELRHGRLAELRVLRLRRRRVRRFRRAGAGPAGRRDRGAVRGRTTRQRRSRSRAPISRAVGLQAVHRGGHPVGRALHGRRGIKTAQQAAIWGGTAGPQFDPCYHLACDTFANNNNHALEVNSDLIAYAQLTYRVLDRVGQRRPRQSVPGSPSTPGICWPRGHVRDKERLTTGAGPGPAGVFDSACEWSGYSRMFRDHRPLAPDYELEDVLVVEDPKQLRALAVTYPRADRRRSSASARRARQSSPRHSRCRRERSVTT